jgi:hypothetical protein
MRTSGTIAEVIQFLQSLKGVAEVEVQWHQSLGPAAKPLPLPPQAKPRAIQTKDAPGKRTCAVKDCSERSKSMGFCPLHYQKFMNLRATGRLEQYGWAPHAPPNSLDNPVLPRGRQAQEAIPGVTVKAVPPKRVAKPS